MLQLKDIQENKEDIIKRLAVKNFDAKEIIVQIIELDNKRKSTQTELDNNQSQSNSIAKEIGQLFQNGEKEKAESLKEKSSELKNSNKTLSDDLNTVREQLNELLSDLPNPPHQSVKSGKTGADNEIVYQVDDIPELGDDAKSHWELANEYNLIDFETGSKITGSGFPVYLDKGAKLQRALINFFLDNATEAGYKEVQPPIVVNEDSAYATGQLPDKEGQMYHIQDDNLYLIPTAEVPLTNIYRDEIIKEEDLPLKITGYTPCFRREAGSYGKDVKGLNRLHQFDKVEIVQITHPDNSYEVLEEMKDYVAGVLEKLELPYRIARLCGGEMSFANALCYDFEVYSAAQKQWLEVSSVSNFESFQANRLKLRYKSGNDKPQILHTLNGSALGFSRTVASLLENNQTSDGIKIPKALQEYTGFEIISK